MHLHAKTPPAVQSTPVCRLQGNGGAVGGGGGGGGGLFTEDEDTEEEDEEEGSFTRGALEWEREAETEAEEVEHGGDAFCSSGGVLAMEVDCDMLSPLICKDNRLGGLEGDFEGVRDEGLDWLGHSSERNEGSGVLQLLSTVWESGDDSLVSRDGGKDNGDVCGGEEDGGSTLADEEVEDDEEDDGVGPGRAEGGLDGLDPTPTNGCISDDTPTQPSPTVLQLLLAFLASLSSTVSPFSLGFLPGLLLRFAASDDVGEEADEDVDVAELGLAFFDFSPPGLVEEGGPRMLRCFPVLLKSLLLPGRAKVSEQGLRKGDRLSLSRRNTTAIDPPTTDGPEAPLTTPLGPRRSMPNFPGFPVVLLTPSRTRTDTLDCSLPFLLLPPSFLDLPERPASFFPALSLPVFRPRLVADEDAVGWRDVLLPEEAERGGERDDRRLLLLAFGLWEDEEEVDSDSPAFLPDLDFFFILCRLTLGATDLILGLSIGASRGGGSNGESSSEG